MPQFARPDSTVTAGLWGTSAASLQAAIDEVTADDSTASERMISATDPNLDECEIGLSDVTDPVSSTGHILRYGYRKNTAAGGLIDIRVQLVQTSTVIATATHVNVAETGVIGTLTLSGAEADSITNYPDLRLRFRADQTDAGTARRGVIYWAEFEVPDVAAGGNVYSVGMIASA